MAGSKGNVEDVEYVRDSGHEHSQLRIQYVKNVKNYERGLPQET